MFFISALITEQLLLLKDQGKAAEPRTLNFHAYFLLFQVRYCQLVHIVVI